MAKKCGQKQKKKNINRDLCKFWHCQHSQNKEFPKLSLAKITLEIHIQRWITIKRDTDTDEQKDAETFVVAASDVSEL